MGHVTLDTWHITGGGIWTFSQNFSFLALDFSRISFVCLIAWFAWAGLIRLRGLPDIRHSLISGWEVVPDLPEQDFRSCSKNQTIRQTSLICEKFKVRIMVFKIHFYLINFFRDPFFYLNAILIYLNITSLTAGTMIISKSGTAWYQAAW